MSQPPTTSRTHYSPAQSRRGRKSRWERRRDYVRRKSRRYREEARQVRFWNEPPGTPQWVRDARRLLLAAGWTCELVGAQSKGAGNPDQPTFTLRCMPPGGGQWHYPNNVEEIETWLQPSQ